MSYVTAVWCFCSFKTWCADISYELFWHFYQLHFRIHSKLYYQPEPKWFLNNEILYFVHSKAFSFSYRMVTLWPWTYAVIIPICLWDITACIVISQLCCLTQSWWQKPHKPNKVLLSGCIINFTLKNQWLRVSC